MFNMAVMGLRLAPARQRRLPAARCRQPRDVRRTVAGLRRRRGADHQRSPTVSTPHLGRPQGLRAGPQAPRHQPTSQRRRLGAHRRRFPRDAVWATKREMRAAARRRGPAPHPPSWLEARRLAGRARLGRRHPRPRRADHRLRPPGADLQAAHPDAARPRPAQAPAARTPSGRSSSSSPASRTRPTRPASSSSSRWSSFADDPEVRHRIVFLPNYDIAMAQHLYPGCDVWLNNPLRPFEACGTSGMKAALNGGLNLSILDGWWDEWFDGKNGWAIPTADGVEDPERRDDIEAAALYDLIENQVAPRFYDIDDERPPAELAGDDARTPSRPSGRRSWPAGWCATTPSSSTGPAARAGLGARRRATYAGARDLAAYKAKVAQRRGRRCTSTTSSPPVSVTPGDRRDAARDEPTSRSATSPPTRSRCRSCTAAPTTTATSCTTSRRCRWPIVESYERRSPPVRRRPGAAAARERSATPCGSCRSTPAWRTRARSAWSPTPDPRPPHRRRPRLSRPTFPPGAEPSPSRHNRCGAKVKVPGSGGKVEVTGPGRGERRGHGAGTRRSRVMSASVRHPVRAIVRSSSARMLRSTSATPSAPASARP